MVAGLFFIGIFWVAPIFVGHQIGKPKNRAGWAWGLFLGWIGVVIVAVLGPSTPPTGLRRQGELATFRPRFVTGSIAPGFTYGFRSSDQALLRQAVGTDQWMEVSDVNERADVLVAMEAERAAVIERQGGAWRQQASDGPPVRQCPHCLQPLLRQSSDCPHCGGESEAWVLNDGVWWARNPGGEWRYLDEKTQSWLAEGELPSPAPA